MGGEVMVGSEVRTFPLDRRRLPRSSATSIKGNKGADAFRRCACLGQAIRARSLQPANRHLDL